MDKQPSEIVKRHISCPCGDSSDAYSIYSDGHGYCFSCSKYFPATSDDTLRSTEEKGEFIRIKFLPPGRIVIYKGDPEKKPVVVLITFIIWPSVPSGIVILFLLESIINILFVFDNILV